MYEYMTVKIDGVLPQLMHNGRLKNPLDPWAKEIKKYSGKKPKVDDDHIAMMEAEYKGSLYLFDDDAGAHPYDGKFPYWPADNLHACIKTQAKTRRLGKAIDSAVIFHDGRLEAEIPKTRNELWEDDSVRLVKATGRGTMCCRPKFNDWSVTFCLQYLEAKINADELKQIIVDAGKYIGLSDWPRRYGLFTVAGFSNKETEIDVTK